MLSLIVSMDKNRVIGIDNQLPWQGNVPADMRYFKRTTYGSPVIMGRNTWESLPQKFRPLDGRRNIVLSHQVGMKVEGAEVFASLNAAIYATRDATEAFVIGGGKLYEFALPYADRLYITRILGEFEGDTHFPEIDLSEWEVMRWVEEHHCDTNNLPCIFAVYRRRCEHVGQHG